MPSAFDVLDGPGPKRVEYEEWGGQFSCIQDDCEGYALIARYLRKDELLVWKCQYDHISKIKYID